MRMLILVTITIIALAGCATRQSQLEAYLTLDKEHFRNTVTIKDDSLDTVARFSTVNGFQEKRGVLGIMWDDNFLRGFIDKKTGKRSYQVYNLIQYTGSNWRFYNLVNYEAPGGPRSKELILISRDVNCSGSRYGGCTYAEHVAFDVDEELLRFVARLYQPGARVAWRYKLVPKRGEDYQDGLLPAEIAGFLQRMDEYSSGKGW